MTSEPTRARVERDVLNILREALEAPAAAIVPAASLIDDLGAESIDLLDIRFRIERALGLRITNEELVEAFGKVETAEEFRARFTVGAMIDYLVARLEAAGG